MKGIDHLVLAGRDLDAMRRAYAGLGFTLTPPARHPFGTGNSLAQFDGSFLELLTVVEPGEVPEHAPGHFSFAAFNRDFLTRGEGLSMLVLDSRDAGADAAHFRERGIATYRPFDFSRRARLPKGEDATVGFSLAFATCPEAPRAGFFCCQQHAPQHFWKAEYQDHANTAIAIAEACLVASKPREIAPFLEAFCGIEAESTPWRVTLRTARGNVVAMTPEVFEDRYGAGAPPLDCGAAFGGYTIMVRDMQSLDLGRLDKVHERRVVRPEEGFGTAIAFCPSTRQ